MGGPARQDAPKAVEALKRLNVPYLVSLPLVFQTTEEWMDSELGLHPVQVALQVRLPPSTSRPRCMRPWLHSGSSCHPAALLAHLRNSHLSSCNTPPCSAASMLRRGSSQVDLVTIRQSTLESPGST